MFHSFVFSHQSLQIAGLPTVVTCSHWQLNQLSAICQVSKGNEQMFAGLPPPLGERSASVNTRSHDRSVFQPQTRYVWTQMSQMDFQVPSLLLARREVEGTTWARLARVSATEHLVDTAEVKYSSLQSKLSCCHSRSKYLTWKYLALDVRPRVDKADSSSSGARNSQVVAVFSSKATHGFLHFPSIRVEFGRTVQQTRVTAGEAACFRLLQHNTLENEKKCFRTALRWTRIINYLGCSSHSMLI